MSEPDADFYDRADSHIALSNEQLAQAPDLGVVSASMMFGTARYNAFWSATTCQSREHFESVREEVVEYLCKQYRMMLEDHLDDYAANFERYMAPK